jgi:mRNA interferase RelE/StbE
LNWTIRVDRRVGKELKNVPQSINARIRTKLILISEDPYQFKHIALKSKRLKGYFRLRIGDWRIFYTLDSDNQEIIVWSVSHRADAYSEK